VDGAVAGPVVGPVVALPAAAEPDDGAALGEVVADDELDDEQLATAARTISAPATWPARPAARFPLPELGNTPVPPIWGATCAVQLSMTVGQARGLHLVRRARHTPPTTGSEVGSGMVSVGPVPDGREPV
jgi:hypothetical protein